MRQLFIVLIVIFWGVGVISAENAPQTIFTVNSTNDVDDGTCNASHCSLREAINAANSAGGIDTIRFSFMTNTTIQPNNPLPDITGRVNIDGITGTGSTCPTSASNPANLKITIDGINANTDTKGFVFNGSSDFSTVRGLNIVRFDDDAIYIESSSDGVQVTCNHIGLPNADSGGFANGNYGVHVRSTLNEIGGSDHADRNVIVGIRGIHISGNVNFIANNYIGTNRSGSVGLGVVDPSSLGMFINSDGNTIESNVIGGYSTAIRLITDNSGNQFHSNKIGTDRTGNNPIPNGLGLEVQDATDLTIGGSAAEGNIIAHNTESGIQLTDSDNVTVSHNVLHNNHYGVETDSAVFQNFNDDNVYQSNTIYSNTIDGMLLSNGDRPTIDSNLIYDNGRHGIYVNSGGAATIESNTIYDNLADGVRVHFYSTENTIRMNSIYDNAEMGIELRQNGAPDGITPNDSDDDDTGGNGVQNFPELISADATGNISGSFRRDTANTFGYTVDVYRNDACDDQTLNGVPHGEGKTWVASFEIGLGVTQETFNWSHNLPNQPVGDFLTLTATDYQGNTSEFGNCVEIESIDFVVDSGNNWNDLDAGDGVCLTQANNCTLIAAVQEANALGGATITFDVSGGANIFLVNPLIITVPVVIDGATNPGANCATQTQTVQLFGQAIPANNDLLVLGVGSGGSTIKGLVLVDAPLSGLHIDSNNNTIVCNRIGVQSNDSALANGEHGVFVDGGNGNVIGGASSADTNLIQHNDVAAVFVSNGANNTTIQGNTIANSGRHAVDVQNSTNVTIAANDILDSGTLGNGSGIRILTSGNVTVGGATSALGNTIVDYSGSGVFIDNGGDNMTIQNNMIGASSLRVPTVNQFHGVHVDDDIRNVLVQDNTITQNNGNGVRVDNDSIGIQILSNEITANGGIGIDLGENGVSANDIGQGDGDEGANGLQNYPVILGLNVDDGEISFELDSKPDQEYLVQFFANGTCDGTHGEGVRLIGEMPVETDGNGYVQSLWKFGGFSADDIITATATDADKDGTSEFSACVPIAPPTAVEISGQWSVVSGQWLVVVFVLLSLCSVGALVQRFRFVP